MLRYRVAGGVSVVSNIQATCDTKKILPTKGIIIWSDSFGIYLASGGDLFETLVTYIVIVSIPLGGSWHP